MTPHPKHPPEQGTPETNSQKQKNLVTELSRALADEHKENRHLQENCFDDCKEHDL
jgi:hypothetical protein